MSQSFTHPRVLTDTGGSMPGSMRLAFVACLGAIGLIVPQLTRIRPLLTPLAAAGLAVIMVLAGGFHVMRHEPGLMVNVVFCALCAFVAWGRWKAAPIDPR